jgi:hypothetical protein
VSEKYKHVSLINELMKFSAKKSDIAVKLVSILDSIIDGDLLLSPIIHPLGFIHVDLGNDDQGCSLRLHIWDNSIDSSIHDKPVIHQHNRSIRSLVLCGEIVNTVYQVDFNISSATHSVYEVCYQRDSERMHDLIKYTGDSACALISYEHRILTGEYYDLDVTLFHRSFVNNSFASTLVLAGKKQAIYPRILGQLHGPSEYTFTRRSMDDSAFKVLVQRLSMKLKA